jgi:energy-coupling factor transporter ATP-binding protein EcfA2
LACRCESIRGAAPPGELFAFEFHGESNLIYGPNGSGKSSLLTAVLWCLTGEIIADSELEDEESPMYRVTGSTSKLRDWPHVVTLPKPAGFEAASPACWAEVRLQRAADGKNLWLRRTYPAVLEASWDGNAWSPCNDLSEFRITPLDLQLSLIAPTIFSRRSLEEARNVRSILTLMLGFDNLEELGDLASKISGNRTRLQKFEEATLHKKTEDIRALLNQLAHAFPESSTEKQTLSKLATTGAPSRKEFEEAQKAVDKALSAAEQALAQDLGLTEAKGNALAGLADKVTVGLAQLEKGVAACFPSLAALQLASVLPPTEDASSEQLLHGIRSALVEYRNRARQAIARRADWWRRERVPGSKVTLLLEAAQYYDPNQKVCPVCDRHIDDTKLNAELTSLRTLDPQLAKQLQMFFADLTKGLKEILPQSVLSLVEATPTKRLLADWSAICGELGPALMTLTQTYEKKMKEIASTITLKQISEPVLLPPEADEVFQAEAAEFLQVVADAEQALGLLEWAVDNLAPILNELDKLITTQSDTSSRTLYMALAQGKRAAADVKPLAGAKSGLATATRASTDIETLRLGVERLKKLADPLDKLKLLSKYAESEVRTVFDSIREATIENAKHLYPESATGMKLGHLKMGKGKNRSIEAMLSTETYQVPGQSFANSGLQRAVALSFYFALLKKHPGGLGFLVMDDPILSLDEDHRERWSLNILRPVHSSMQVVLTTHQLQYLTNCSSDFSPGRIVRLNPRTQEQRISCQPGDRLRRAEHMLSTHHREAAEEMRKFREDILSSFNACSPTPFFNQHSRNLTDSLKAYGNLVPPHPLVSKNRDRIAAVLREQVVTCVLDPALHSLTEADVTKPMVEDCLERLLSLEQMVGKELERLERLRKHRLRGSHVPATLLPFSRLNERVTWSERLCIPFIGAAAARSNPWVVEMRDESQMLSLSAGAAVLVARDILEPVARYGQWVLLATEDIAPNDGDLVAAEDSGGNRYLRRV